MTKLFIIIIIIFVGLDVDVLLVFILPFHLAFGHPFDLLPFLYCIVILDFSSLFLLKIWHPRANIQNEYIKITFV